MKRLFSIMMILCLLCATAAPAFAEHYTGGDDWSVAFTAATQMESNFKTADMDDILAGLQPGDDVTFTVYLTNQHPTTTDWYMTNEVLQSLEDASADSATHGGAYTYRLVYTSVSGEEEVLFDSDTVGGDDIVTGREGLHEATASLEDYFYLDTIAQGQSSHVTLTVALEGETQGNDYQDTLAQLQMNFAVELDSTSTNVNKIVKTGDDMNLVPYYIAMAVSGVLFLILAIDGVRQRKKEKEADS